jgi:hypothetical protein
MNNKQNKRSPIRVRRSPSRMRKSPLKRNSTITPKKSDNVVALFISELFNSRNQAHILHLQTESFAAHKALNAYYDAIIPLADKYAETYQGLYGIIKGYTGLQTTPLEGEENIVPYFKELEKNVKDMGENLPKDLDLENNFADILDLIHTTNYLLTLN